MFPVLSQIIEILDSIRECGMGFRFSCSRRQSVTAARRSSTMDDEGPRAAQSGSENHFLVASTVIA